MADVDPHEFYGPYEPSLCKQLAAQGEVLATVMRERDAIAGTRDAYHRQLVVAERERDASRERAAKAEAALERIGWAFWGNTNTAQFEKEVKRALLEGNYSEEWLAARQEQPVPGNFPLGQPFSDGG